jgi:hypothetical protein
MGSKTQFLQKQAFHAELALLSVGVKILAISIS